MKMRLIGGGVLAALLSACASGPSYYEDRYYGDRYSYNRYDEWRVTSIEVLQVERSRHVADPYRITVRGPSGNYETYYMESLGALRVGDRVRVANGTIYPVG